MSESKEELVKELIESEVVSLFYASPKKQCEYFVEVLNIDVDIKYWEHWFNYKAMRDIIVHNRGIVNNIYNSKVTADEGKNVGDKIMIDYNYYCNSIRNLKSFAGKISGCIKKNYCNKI